MLGIDFFLHAGLLAGIYLQPTSFLLAPEDAFRLIPLGYLALLIQVILLLWLGIRLEIQTWRQGALFGGMLGLLLGGSSFLGLLSISTVPWHYLLAWMFAGIVELTAAGAVMGAGMRTKTLRPIVLLVVIAVLVLMILTITMQNLGWAPANKY